MTRAESTRRASDKRTVAAAVASYARDRTRWLTASTIEVASERDAKVLYVVTIRTGGWACTCPAGQHGRPCKHLRSAADYADEHRMECPSPGVVTSVASEPVWSDYSDVEGDAPSPEDVPPALARNARGGWWAPDWRERLGYTPGASRWPREV